LRLASSIQTSAPRSDNRGSGHSSCAFPDCTEEAEQGGSEGSDRKLPISNTMMQAYVAMRAGVDGVTVSATEPLLGRMLQQELVQELGAPQ
jgi:hypothetical protein